jgi:hypothetical protein
MDLQEVGCGIIDWIELTQDRQVAGTCESGNERLVYIKCGEFLDSLQKLTLTSPTGGGRCVGIVRSLTKATEFSLV